MGAVVLAINGHVAESASEANRFMQSGPLTLLLVVAGGELNSSASSAADDFVPTSRLSADTPLGDPFAPPPRHTGSAPGIFRSTAAGMFSSLRRGSAGSARTASCSEASSSDASAALPSGVDSSYGRFSTAEASAPSRYSTVDASTLSRYSTGDASAARLSSAGPSLSRSSANRSSAYAAPPTRASAAGSPYARFLPMHVPPLAGGSGTPPAVSGSQAQRSSLSISIPDGSTTPTRQSRQSATPFPTFCPSPPPNASGTASAPGGTISSRWSRYSTPSPAAPNGTIPSSPNGTIPASPNGTIPASPNGTISASPNGTISARHYRPFPTSSPTPSSPGANISSRRSRYSAASASDPIFSEPAAVNRRVEDGVNISVAVSRRSFVTRT